MSAENPNNISEEISEKLSRRSDRRQFLQQAARFGASVVAGGLAAPTLLRPREASADGGADEFPTMREISRIKDLEPRPDDELFGLWKNAGVYYDFMPMENISRAAPAVDPFLLESDQVLYRIRREEDEGESFPNFTTVTGVEATQYG